MSSRTIEDKRRLLAAANDLVAAGFSSASLYREPLNQIDAGQIDDCLPAEYKSVLPPAVRSRVFVVNSDQWKDNIRTTIPHKEATDEMKAACRLLHAMQACPHIVRAEFHAASQHFIVCYTCGFEFQRKECAAK